METELASHLLFLLLPFSAVGDFGNENVGLVQTVAAAAVPIAAILGNHDCWYSGSHAGIKRRSLDGLPSTSTRVQQQLAVLGRAHVGYNALRLPELGLQVVGGRPFSRGGGALRPWQEEGRMIEGGYQPSIKSYEASAKAIANKAVLGGRGLSTILLAHSGPTGLGSERHDPCGKDWEEGAGDFGDPDLRMAIERIQGVAHSTKLSLCVFGHMHHKLFGGRHFRNMVQVTDDGMVYINSAVVPRWKTPRALAQDVEAQWTARGVPVRREMVAPSTSAWWWQEDLGAADDEVFVLDRLEADLLDGSRRLRNFTLLTLSPAKDGRLQVQLVRECWAELVSGPEGGEPKLNIAFLADWMRGNRVWKAFSGEWVDSRVEVGPSPRPWVGPCCCPP